MISRMFRNPISSDIIVELFMEPIKKARASVVVAPIVLSLLDWKCLLVRLCHAAYNRMLIGVWSCD